MAKAYLGKISALVTANTSDFNSKLNASAKEVRSFASAMESSLKSAERSAATSLRGIYTESQKVSRALQAVASQRLSFKGFDTSTFASLTQAVEQFKRIQRAASEVNQPLGAAARTVERLSASVQTAFEPAMRSAQRSAENLSAVLNRGGTVGERSFERIRLKAEQAAQAADRLAEASAIAGSGPRGRELAFVAPRVRDSLAASAAARNRAQGAAASVLDDGSVGRSVQQLARLDDLIQRVQATIESRRILNIDTAAAEQRLTRLIRRSGELSESLDAAVAAPAAAAADQAARQADARTRAQAAGELFLRVDQRESTLLSNEGQSQNISAYLQQLEEARVRTERLADARTRAQAVGELFLRVDQRESDLLSREGQRTRLPAGYFEGGLESQARSRMGGDIPGGAGPLGGQLEVGRQVDNVINRVTAARQQLDTLPDPLRTALIPALQRATDQASTLARQGFGATAAQIRNAANEAERFEQRVARSQRALNFGQQFGGQGRRGLEFGLQAQSLQGYTAQLQVLQRTLSGVSTQARGPALDAFNRLRTAIATAADNGTVDLEQTRRQINGVAQDAIRAAAAAAGISPDRLNRQFQRAGDIGRGAFGNIGLGVQQAVFAIDDFFSVTGGLDQRIRAAGNNISQLGFVLGGTTGLIAGVSAAITGQLIVAYIKWANSGKTTEIQANALTSALEKQRTVAEGLRSALESLGRGLAGDVFSNAGRDARQFAEEIAKLRRESAEARADAAAATDPRSLDVEARKSVVAESLKTETNSARAEFLRTSLGDLEAARIRVRKSIADTPAPTADQTRQLLQDTAARLRRANELAAGSPFRDRSRLARQTLLEQDARRVNEGDTFGDILQRRNIVRGQLSSVGAIQPRGPFGASDRIDLSGELEKLRSQLSLLDRSLSQLNDESFIRAAQSINNASELIAKGQNEAAKAFDQGVPGARKLENDLDSLGARLRAARDQLVDAAKIEDPQERNAAQSSAQTEIKAVSDAISARDREIKAIDAARRSVELFASAFDRVRQEAESNFQSAQAAADQARGDDLERRVPRGNPSPERARAERDLESQRVLRDNVRRETALAEERARQDEGIRRREGRIAEIDSQLNGKDVLNQGQRNDLIAERERLRAENDAAVQRAVDNDPAVRNARDASNFEERRRQAQERGFQARKTPAQRAGEELARTINDIQRTFNGGAREFLDNAAPAQRRAVEEAQRQTAPAIFNLADEVQNAVLQGPSRAALQATDVSTVQGASELNRLLRGDDSARNQNLVELQKQSASLSELVAIAKANTGNLPGMFD
jgi:hypothetical protein